MPTSLFELEAKKLNGETISLKEFEGKTIVVVNTASKCGLTPQYEGLENLSLIKTESRSNDLLPPPSRRKWKVTCKKFFKNENLC